MGTIGRDVYRRKLERYLAHSLDEPIIALVSALVAILGGDPGPLHIMPDLSPEAVGAELGSPYHIAPWTLETLVNELLATPKAEGLGLGCTRVLRHDSFAVLRELAGTVIQLENAEDGIFLEKHDVFYEMARIAQRQFPWQRGVANAPHLYRSMLLYGSGSAGAYFEDSTGISVADFVKIGACMSGGLTKSEYVNRRRDLSEIGIGPEAREAALARLAIGHVDARQRAAAMRAGGRHTAYSPSLLRDFPIIAFGERGERLRAPIPELIIYRYTSGLYLDVVRGGAAVWSDIGRRFERYAFEYLSAMMAPYVVEGEKSYGSKKAGYRTPDILVSDATGVIAAVECKAKRMSFEARYADDPVAVAALGFDELAKGIFQLWRFFSHSRREITESTHVSADCQGIVVTADSWLTMARNQAKQVFDAAHALANQDGCIAAEDRCEIAFCQVEDVEYALQHGTADSFLAACRRIASGEKKGFMLSVAHGADQIEARPYPFSDRISEMLPWMARDYEWGNK